MIEYENTRIRKIEGFMRDTINHITFKIDFDKLEEQQMMFVDKVKNRFLFDNSNSWMSLCASLDTLGDSQLAIVSFLNSKIGNGKTFNTGERYLRIYGVLNAIYIHNQSIVNLATIIKLNDPSKLSKYFKKMDISFLRNSIAAHPVNFDNNGTKVNYRIVRMSIDNDTGNLEIVNRNNSFRTYNIYEAIDEYLESAEFNLRKIALKLITNAYKSAPEKQSLLKKKLKELTEIN